MSSTIFKFKQFSVSQAKSAMKVGTDGVLLGAWCAKEGKDGRNILDIGTGTGVISLIAAQYFAKAQIVAVEVEKDAFDEASQNFEASSWGDRITLEHATFQNFSENCANAQKFDIVVTNPPYFVNSLKNESLAKVAARHAELLPYEDLAAGVSKVLSAKGELFIILPYDHSALFIALAAMNGLVLRKRVDVRGTHGKPFKRSLLKFSREKGECFTSSLTIEGETRGEYTDKYKELTSSLYLKF